MAPPPGCVEEQAAWGGGESTVRKEGFGPSRMVGVLAARTMASTSGREARFWGCQADCKVLGMEEKGFRGNQILAVFTQDPSLSTVLLLPQQPSSGLTERSAASRALRLPHHSMEREVDTAPKMHPTRSNMKIEAPTFAEPSRVSLPLQ